ncbi:MAG: P27 family phage terminase small subunit [Prevotella sp.]|nr:P27 family phage terminase small subunit [Prevotella sp.]
MAKKVTAITLRRSLIEQLEKKGNNIPVFISLVDNYMELFATMNGLQDDIKARGVVVSWDNGGGQKGVKKNDSIDQLNKTSAQMLKILKELGIKAESGEVIEEITL